MVKQHVQRIQVWSLALIFLFMCSMKADAPVNDPPVARTIGFFMNDWQPKTFTVLPYKDTVVPAGTTGNLITVDAGEVITRIPASEFGHNANTWMTAMVTEPVFLNHVNNLHPHIIRFPAGSGSDAYFWNRAPGDLPADVPHQLTDKSGNRKSTGFFFGRTTGSHSASLDDYYEMLKQTGNQGLFTVNYGYARYGTSADPVATAAHLAADWVRYDHGRTQYWEVGNENFGDWECGYRIDTTQNKDGQPAFLTGALYAKHFKIFADSMKRAAAESGHTIYIGAVTFETAPKWWQTNTVRTWNSGMMKEINDKADFYVVHNYFTPYNANTTAADILSYASTVPGKMMDYVTGELQKSGAALKPVAMDEWNMFAVNSRQQVSNISGVFAVIVMGEALLNKYGMAARWDMLNAWANGNDHGLFSAGDEPGVAKWTPRPSFYYMYFMQRCIGDRLVNAEVKGDTSLRAYASTFSSGEINLTVANISTQPQTVNVKFRNFEAGKRFYWYSLQGDSDNGEFSRKVVVNGKGTTGSAGGPDGYATLPANSTSTANGIWITVPARGVVCMVTDKK
jgi:hypothetical protein